MKKKCGKKKFLLYSKNMKKISIGFVVSVFLFFIFACAGIPDKQDRLDRPDNSSVASKKKSVAYISPQVSKKKSINSYFSGEQLRKAVADKKVTTEDGTLFLPVRDKNNFVYVSGYFANKKALEIYVLFSAAIEGEAEEMSLQEISDLKNIYQEDVQLRKYLIFGFTFTNGKIAESDSFILQGKGAFDYLNKIEIDKNKELFALTAGFVSSIGTQEEIIVFDSEGKRHTTMINNTMSDFTKKTDIDKNGILDLLRYEQVFIDGSGAETFISWYKFNGREYERTKSVNTVKDLKSFISDAEIILEKGNQEVFINQFVSSSVLEKLHEVEYMDSKVMQRIFIPTGEGSDINQFFDSGKKLDFIFPVILESPFRVEPDKLYSFTMDVRVSAKDGAVEKKEEIFIVRIYMANNPFLLNRFFFFVNR